MARPCEMCGAPAVHAEHFYNRVRAWCDPHTPWSGHYDHCNQTCVDLAGQRTPAEDTMCSAEDALCPDPRCRRTREQLENYKRTHAEILAGHDAIVPERDQLKLDLDAFERGRVRLHEQLESAMKSARTWERDFHQLNESRQAQARELAEAWVYQDRKDYAAKVNDLRRIVDRIKRGELSQMQARRRGPVVRVQGDWEED